MLYEAFYPSELSDNHPHKVFYGFVQEDVKENYQNTLVIFYPKLMGTSLFNLSEEIKSGLANFLLTKHIYGVGVSFLKVAFLCPHISQDKFYGECWSVDVFNDYIYEAEAKKTLIQKIMSPKIKSILTRNLTIGSTQKIQLIDMVNVDFERTEFLLNELKKNDFGDFSKFFGGQL